MRSSISRTLIVMGLVLAGSTALAQEWQVLLSPKGVDELAALNPEAVAIYKDAADQIDKINYEEGVRLLADAASKTPNHVDLQFLVVKLALNRASNYWSESTFTTPPETMDYSSPPWRVAEPFLSMAEAAIQRLSTNSTLSIEERRRVENNSTSIEKLRGELSTRDKEWLESGLPVIELIAERRIELNNLGTETDELDPYQAYGKKKPSELKAEEKQKERFNLLNPFSLLPGEVLKDFLPPPPPPPQAGGGAFAAGGGFIGEDEFGNPVQPPAAAPAGPADPFGNAPAF